MADTQAVLLSFGYKRCLLLGNTQYFLPIFRFLFEFLNNKIQNVGGKKFGTGCSSAISFQVVPVQQSDNKAVCEAGNAPVTFSVPLRDT